MSKKSEERQEKREKQKIREGKHGRRKEVARAEKTIEKGGA